MKTGINLLLWTGNTRTETCLPLLARIKEWGFDGAEVPVFHYDENVFRAIGERAKELGLGLTAVTVMPEAANPISEDGVVRAAAVEHLKGVLNICGVLGAKVLCGPLYSPVGRLVGRPRTEDEWKWAVEAMRQAADVAVSLGVTIAVEPLNRFETYFLNTLADTCHFVRTVGHPSVKMMADSFHGNIEEKNMNIALFDYEDELAHIHISENDRGVPGTGQVLWRDFFKGLKVIGYDRWLMIESFSHTVPEIAKAASIWRPVSPSQEEVAVKGLAFVRRMWQEAESPITV